MASYSGTSSAGSPNGGALAGRAQELFEIRTPNDFAYSMASIAWSSQPQAEVVAEELERHELHTRREADDARPVELRRDRPGDVRPVEVVVGVVDGLVVVAEVPAVDVVDVAVRIVVDVVGLLAAARLPGLTQAWPARSGS